MDLFDLWYDDLMKGDQPYIRQFENYIGILADTIRRPATSVGYAITSMWLRQTEKCTLAIFMCWMSINWEI